MIAQRYEPLLQYRFLIEFKNQVIDSFVVKKFLYYHHIQIFLLEIYLPIGKYYKIENVREITIKWLDPGGTVVDQQKFKLSLLNWSYKGDYKESAPLILEMKFKVNKAIFNC